MRILDCIANAEAIATRCFRRGAMLEDMHHVSERYLCVPTLHRRFVSLRISLRPSDSGSEGNLGGYGGSEHLAIRLLEYITNKLTTFRWRHRRNICAVIIHAAFASLFKTYEQTSDSRFTATITTTDGDIFAPSMVKVTSGRCLQMAHSQSGYFQP